MNNINKLVLAIGFTLTTFPSLAAGTTTTPRSLTGSLTG